KVIEFTDLISSNQGDLLVHCQSGVSRSAAVALIVVAELLGVGREKDALAYVLAARPQALPNLWIVQLADDILNRGGRLVEAVQQHHDAVK
ncbi:MAG: PBS lyase, partial [Coleofasciculus sp. C2-GNP5-27]